MINQMVPIAMLKDTKSQLEMINIPLTRKTLIVCVPAAQKMFGAVKVFNNASIKFVGDAVDGLLDQHYTN